MKRYAVGGFRQNSGKPKWEVQGENLRKRKRLEGAKRRAASSTEKKPKKARTLTVRARSAPRRTKQNHSHDDDVLSAIKAIQDHMEHQETFQKQAMETQKKMMELQKKELELHAREMESRMSVLERSIERSAKRSQDTVISSDEDLSRRQEIVIAPKKLNFD